MDNIKNQTIMCPHKSHKFGNRSRKENVIKKLCSNKINFDSNMLTLTQHLKFHPTRTDKDKVHTHLDTFENLSKENAHKRKININMIPLWI